MGLRFRRRADARPIAQLSVTFYVTPVELETGIIYAYQHELASEAVPQIECLTKTAVTALCRRLHENRGGDHQFIGEDTDPAIVAAAEHRVRQMWPELHG